MAVKTKTILAIEPLVNGGRAVSSQLRRAGYNVVVARTTNEAYTLLQDHPEVDLLLADLLAPGTFDATNLVERASVLRAGLQVLITTNLGRFVSVTNHDRSHGAQPLIAVLRILLGDG